MNCYEENKEILEWLEKVITENKELRFIQALWILDIINEKEPNADRFYEPSRTTLKKVLERVGTSKYTSYNKVYMTNPYQEEVRKQNTEYAILCFSQQKEIERLNKELIKEREENSSLRLTLDEISRNWTKVKKGLIKLGLKDLKMIAKEM